VARATRKTATARAGAWVVRLMRPNAPHEGPSASGRPREGQDMTHRWNWRKWLPERHGQLCRVLATGRMNSALVEFEDGTKVVTSRYAVRKLTHNAALSGAEPQAERPR